MTDLILQIGATKLALSVALAALAWAVTRRLGRPALSHALWLLLLAALLAPPLVSIPVFAPRTELTLPLVTGLSSASPPPSSLAVSLAGWLAGHWKAGLLLLWLFGTATVVSWSLFRTLRLRRHLMRASEVAPAGVQRVAGEIAGQLGLRNVPPIYTTQAHVSPMVWWGGNRLRVLIPAKLASGLKSGELRCILAHELAHVRRRDHLVRWLEWLACAVFWWNPVAWRARRELRRAQEYCSDALASSSISAQPRVYAGALLRTVEFMSTASALRCPAFVSTAADGQSAISLERRIRMIFRDKPRPLPRWLRGTFLLAAVCMLAAGLVYCTDDAELTSGDAPPTLAAGEVRGNRAAVGEILSTWLDSLRNLEATGPELDTPWSRHVSAGIHVHLDSLVAEGPAGPNATALQAGLMHASIEGPQRPAGSPQRFLMLNRTGENEPSETVIVDLTRLSEASGDTGLPLSPTDLEAVIRRSASLREAGWRFSAVFGFSGND
ncbi:MAG: M56 family metallopeptidase [Gemmatimonadetes bacterium]|nr:M56 family metallopeptidase [Candidatus Palauibacter rhopaloidicola]